MIRKKNSFFTFIFSLLPGAGQMYMGFMKRGVSLMSAFFLVIFFAFWIGLEPLLLILPIIWFYAFFDTHSLRTMPEDEFYAMEDEYILFPDILKEHSKAFQGSFRNIIAIAFIVIGVTVLWNNFLNLLPGILPDHLRQTFDNFNHYFPQTLVGVAIVGLGVYLIIGKKNELNNMEDNQDDKYKFLDNKNEEDNRS